MAAIATGAWVRVVEGAVRELVVRPRWFGDDGVPVSDAFLLGYGYYPVFEELPAFDPLTQTRTANDPSAWTVEAERVLKTYTIADLPAATRDARIREAIIAERARRLALGFDYDFADARGVHRIGTTAQDMIGWDEVTKIALARQALGTATPIAIVTDTGPVEVTPTEWLAILEAANAFRQPIWHASFALAAQQPPPRDFENDVHWS